MSIKPIILLPNTVLRKQSEPVERFDDELQKLAADMTDTMYDAPGIGLAAVQIGVLRRLLVIDVSKDEDNKNPQVFINPEVVDESDERGIYDEGCLSIPDYYAEVERPASIKVNYLDLSGKAQTIQADGLMATCLQHEIDHLNGVLFIDYLSKLKKNMVIKKFTKLAKQQSPEL